jgi:DNA-binding MarR family transcriptional regulator
MTKRTRPIRRRALTRSDYNTLAQFRYVLRQFQTFSEIAARGIGLSPQQHQALLALRGFAMEEPLTMGELAVRLNLQQHSAVGLVNRLARRGLVCRRPDPKDARRVRVLVSARGEKLLARLSRVHREELRRLASLLKRLLASLE